MNNEIDCVICLWEWNSSTKRWIHEDTYGVDDNSHPCTKAKYAKERDRDGGFHSFLYKASGMWNEGRAVTCWSKEDGVKLLDFTAPSQVDWIDWYNFKDTIKKNWMGSLKGAYEMKMDTARKALELITLTDVP